MSWSVGDDETVDSRSTEKLLSLVSIVDGIEEFDSRENRKAWDEAFSFVVGEAVEGWVSGGTLSYSFSIWFDRKEIFDSTGNRKARDEFFLFAVGEAVKDDVSGDTGCGDIKVEVERRGQGWFVDVFGLLQVVVHILLYKEFDVVELESSTLLFVGLIVVAVLSDEKFDIVLFDDVKPCG